MLKAGRRHVEARRSLLLLVTLPFLASVLALGLPVTCDVLNTNISTKRHFQICSDICYLQALTRFQRFDIFQLFTSHLSLILSVLIACKTCIGSCPVPQLRCLTPAPPSCLYNKTNYKSTHDNNDKQQPLQQGRDKDNDK